MPGVIRRGCVVLGVVLAVSWPGAALAQAGQVEPTDQVVLSGDVNVPRGTVVGEVVVFSGSATIDGVAEGDVVVLDGPVSIGGQVGGDVIALDGPIRLLATAQVTGDVLAGGNLISADGAQVNGEIRRDVGFTLAGPVAVLGAVLVSIAMAVSILLVGLLMLLLAPRGAERTAEAASEAPWASVGWGSVMAVGLPIVAVVAAATIVGLPLGLAVLLGLALVWLIGQAAVTFIVGRLIVRAPRSRVGALFAGWGIGGAIGLVPFLNVVWWGLGAVFGLGAIVVASWRARHGAALVPGGRVGMHARRGKSADSAPPTPAPVATGGSTERPADVPPAED
jgi:hypothetical protein